MQSGARVQKPPPAQMPSSYNVWEVDDSIKGTCIGIDLGTTNSCVAVWNEDRHEAVVLCDEHGERVTPSVVALSTDADPLGSKANASDHGRKVGAPAMALRDAAPTAVVAGAKRLLGKSYTDIAIAATAPDGGSSSAGTSADADGASNASVPHQLRLPFRVEQDTLRHDGVAGAIIASPDGRERLTPVQISAIILRRLKAIADAQLGLEHGVAVQNAVVTVPAHFSHRQRDATLAAARQAGFDRVRLLAEPTAAAIAYGLFVAGSKTVAVFDLGGGTFDVSVLRIDQQPHAVFRVLATGGDNKLGGDDVTTCLMNWVLQRPGMASAKEDSASDHIFIAALRRACERAKVVLSEEDETEIEVKRNTTAEGTSTRAIPITITRLDLERLSAPLFERALEITRLTLADAGVRVDEVDEVIMVGGATRTPSLRAAVAELFSSNGDPKQLCLAVDPDLVVAEGAAIQAAILAGADKRTLEDVLMIDVLPMSIGLETGDGGYEVLLERNSTIPCKVTKYFEVAEDGQPGVTIEVYEGEDESCAAANHHIGYYNFVLPRHSRKRGARVPVTFSLNEAGMLQVSAGTKHAETEEEDYGIGLGVLTAYCVCLFALWVVVRVYFSDLQQRLDETTASATAIAGHVANGADGDL